MKYPILFCILAVATQPIFAQKAAIKFIQHQKYVIAEGGDLKLSFQIEQSYNRFGSMIKQEYFYPKPNSQQLQTDRKIVYSYDNSGRHLSTLEYNGDNILESEIKVYWDEKDNKSKVEEIKYTNGEQASTNTTYLLQYDEQGNKKNETYYTSDGEKERERIWIYNRQNELTKNITTVAKKNQAIKKNIILYKRDKEGNLARTLSREIVNGKEYRKDVQFFASNHVIRWRKYINGKFESEFINEYRDSVVIRTTKRNTRKVISLEQAQRQQKRQEKQQKKRARRNNTEIWITNSEYDVYGNIAITTQSMNGKAVFITQYDYDDYGNCIKVLKSNKETGDKEEEVVEYEMYGNVSKRINRKNGKLLSEERFSFEYYPND